jgi:hypothetical protein
MLLVLLLLRMRGRPHHAHVSTEGGSVPPPIVVPTPDSPTGGSDIVFIVTGTDSPPAHSP